MPGNILGTGRACGSLGAASTAGLPLGVMLSGIYMLPWKVAAKEAVREIGRREAALAFRKAGSRMAGKLLTGSREWVKAFEHVAEHFTEEALKNKAKHAVFSAAYRSRSALEPLIKDAVTKPSRKVASRLTLYGQNLGEVCIVLEREFGQVIGEEISMEGGKEVRKSAKILRVVVTCTGRPVTAFPVANFLQ